MPTAATVGAGIEELLDDLDDPSIDDGKDGVGVFGICGTGILLLFVVLATDCAVETLNAGVSEGARPLIGLCDVFAVL